MLWPFTKYSGCGNDFIFFDNRKGGFPLENRRLIQQLCHRQWGIGADGILLLETSPKADFRMRILNADGSEAEMCGNGIRCLVKGYESVAKPQKTYLIETMHRLLKASSQEDDVAVEMGNPTSFQWNIPLTLEDKIHLHHLDTGVPHTILFVDPIDQFDLKKWGPFIRHHSHWQPRGTNFTVVQQMDKHRLRTRTFERGVEGETLGCGTGATAAALAAAHLQGIQSPILVSMPAGDLTIGFDYSQGSFSNVTMSGPAKEIFSGNIDL